VHPLVGGDVARREAESLDYMGFGFGRTAQEDFCETSVSVCIGRIVIEPQYLLEFRDPLCCPVCENLDATQGQWAHG
jgi:hypothetical protein